MKKLIALLAVLGFVPYANAADGADFSHSGEFRLQYQNDMNADGTEKTADSPKQNWHQRLRWGSSVRAGEKLTGNFTLVHNSDWGQNTDQFPDTIGTDRSPAGAADGNADHDETQNILLVNEAYMSWMMNDSWMIRAGRGSMTMADGRFVSSNDWEEVSKAFDGVLATYDHEMARFGFFGVMGAKEDAFNSFGRFYGVSADFKTLPSFLKAAHLHIVQKKTDLGTFSGVAVDKEDNMRWGLMVSGDMNGLDYRANYETESGESKKANGDKKDIATSMMDLEAGYTMAAMMNTRFFAGYHTDSGSTKNGATDDDETYDGFHYDQHNNAGQMDIVRWGNLTYMRFGATMQPMDDVNVGAEYFMFTQTEKKDVVTSDNAAFNKAFDANNTEDDIGTELDIWATKKYTNNFNITARYGMFMPGDRYKTSGPAGGKLDDTYSQVYVESKLTF